MIYNVQMKKLIAGIETWLIKYHMQEFWSYILNTKLLAPIQNMQKVVFILNNILMESGG